jgi:hypothetical protein
MLTHIPGLGTIDDSAPPAKPVAVPAPKTEVLAAPPPIPVVVAPNVPTDEFHQPHAINAAPEHDLLK